MAYRNNRITVILNGRQELPKVLENLKAAVEGDGKVLLLTKSGEGEVADALKSALGVGDDWVKDSVTYDRFNKIDYSSFEGSRGDRKIFCIAMPNSLYRTISTGWNDALKFVRETNIARFVHFFADDCKIVSKGYNPAAYEWYMSTFEEPFIMDSKLNQGNYAFKKYSPRFVFMSKTYLRRPISFVQFESKDHFVADMERMKLSFDEKVKRLYIPEFVYRLHKAGLIKHVSFYPDPVLEKWVGRDETMPADADFEAVVKEYSEDEKYLKGELGVSFQVENAVDPIINEMASVIKAKLSMDATEERVDG